MPREDDLRLERRQCFVYDGHPWQILLPELHDPVSLGRNDDTILSHRENVATANGSRLSDRGWREEK